MPAHPWPHTGDESPVLAAMALGRRGSDGGGGGGERAGGEGRDNVGGNEGVELTAGAAMLAAGRVRRAARGCGSQGQRGTRWERGEPNTVPLPLWAENQHSTVWTSNSPRIVRRILSLL